jgi:hypothetical protein
MNPPERPSIFAYGAVEQQHHFGVHLPHHESYIERDARYESGHRVQKRDRYLKPAGYERIPLGFDANDVRTLNDPHNDQRPVWWRNEIADRVAQGTAPMERVERMVEGYVDSTWRVEAEHPGAVFRISEPAVRLNALPTSARP